jgi:uncharacterized protein (TIGR02271 family)
MRTTKQTTTIETGWDVLGSDGEHLGTVAEVGHNYVLVQKGLIFPKDIYVPVSAVERVTDQTVWLNVPKDQVESMGWDDAPMQGSWDTWTPGLGASDTERIAVHEEQLEARKTARQTGEVQVRKDVVEEKRSIDVPVTREEVHVRRVPVDRDAKADTDAFLDRDTIRVPVKEEDVEVVKRPRVKEEIEIETVQRQDTERAEATVRKERVDVSREGDAKVDRERER